MEVSINIILKERIIIVHLVKDGSREWCRRNAPNFNKGRWLWHTDTINGNNVELHEDVHSLINYWTIVNLFLVSANWLVK